MDVHSTLLSSLLEDKLVLYLRTLAQEITNNFSPNFQEQKIRNYIFVQNFTPSLHLLNPQFVF